MKYLPKKLVAVPDTVTANPVLLVYSDNDVVNVTELPFPGTGAVLYNPVAVSTTF